MRYLVELNSHAIASLPDDTAGSFSRSSGMGEGPFRWNGVGVGKLDRHTCEGKIPDYARVLVAAVLRDVWFVSLVSRSNPGFDHGK
jgi:hypothetical protein